MVLRSSRRSNAVSRNNFSCACTWTPSCLQNFGGSIARFDVPGCGLGWQLWCLVSNYFSIKFVLS